jgi:hypothetical protein
MKLKTSNQIKLETVIDAAFDMADEKGRNILKDVTSSVEHVHPREVAVRILAAYRLAEKMRDAAIELQNI